MEQKSDKKTFTPREILRRNLQALIDSKTGPATQGELHRKSKVSQATIGRILNKETSGENARIETVDKLADAYGLQGWQLLIAGMDPKNPPVLAPVTKEEKEFWARMRKMYEELGRSAPPGSPF